MKSFFKIDKKKSILFLVLISIALIFTIIIHYIQIFIINFAKGEKNLELVFKIIIPGINWIFIVLRFYVYTCVSVYLINKYTNNQHS